MLGRCQADEPVSVRTCPAVLLGAALVIGVKAFDGLEIRLFYGASLVGAMQWTLTN